MIIKSHKNIANGIINAEFEGQNLKVRHIENITPIMEEAYKERLAGIGEGRKLIGNTVERIACVPEIVFAEHPELLKDMKALRKYLKNEGSVFRTSTRQI